jgi:hypothetical protein
MTTLKPLRIHDLETIGDLIEYFNGLIRRYEISRESLRPHHEDYNLLTDIYTSAIVNYRTAFSAAYIVKKRIEESASAPNKDRELLIELSKLNTYESDEDICKRYPADKGMMILKIRNHLRENP